MLRLFDVINIKCSLGDHTDTCVQNNFLKKCTWLEMNSANDEKFATLDQAVAAWVESKSTLRELSTRQSQVRKRLKRVEQDLLEKMQEANMTRIEHDGRTVILKTNVTEE